MRLSELREGKISANVTPTDGSTAGVVVVVVAVATEVVAVTAEEVVPLRRSRSSSRFICSNKLVVSDRDLLCNILARLSWSAASIAAAAAACCWLLLSSPGSGIIKEGRKGTSVASPVLLFLSTECVLGDRSSRTLLNASASRPSSDSDTDRIVGIPDYSKILKARAFRRAVYSTTSNEWMEYSIRFGVLYLRYKKSF